MTIGLARRLWGPRAVSVSARRSVFAQGDDAHRSTVRVGMPHLNAGGLSESWLFRHAGDQHWQAIGALSGTTTEHLKTELGARLYPTFLAVRATYEAPLSVVLENDSLSSQVDLSWAARGYTHGFVTLASERNRLQFEMLTMLAERSPTSGELRAAQPSSRWVGTAALGLGRRAAPGIVALAKAARNGERHDDVLRATLSVVPSRPWGAYATNPRRIPTSMARVFCTSLRTCRLPIRPSATWLANSAGWRGVAIGRWRHRLCGATSFTTGTSASATRFRVISSRSNGAPAPSRPTFAWCATPTAGRSPIW